jgi:capsular polysaccharide biosynthesis protein
MNSASDHFKIEMVKSQHSFFGFGSTVECNEISRNDLFLLPGTNSPSILIVDENKEINWESKVRRELCYGSDLEAFKTIYSNTKYNTRPCYLAAFRDAIVDLRTGFFVFDGTKGWSDACLTTIQQGPIHYSPAVEARGDERWFSSSKAAPVSVDVDGSAMLLVHWGSLVNYGHWLANSILAAYLVLPELKSGKISLICPPLSDRQKRELLMLGVPEKRIIETEAQYVRLPHVIYPSPLSTQTNIAPSPICMEAIQALGKSAALQPDQIAPEYLYVSRLGAGSRLMRNELDLIKALASLGITPIYPHELSLDAQIKAFSRARVIIGQLGAALWSMPFAPRGGSYVEILTSNYASFEYLAIANLMDRDLVQIMVDPCKDGFRDNAVFSFDAPIEHIVRAAKTLISESRAVVSA